MCDTNVAALTDDDVEANDAFVFEGTEQAPLQGDQVDFLASLQGNHLLYEVTRVFMGVKVRYTTRARAKTSYITR